MISFKVRCEFDVYDEQYRFTSKVYYVDPRRDRFLVANEDAEFMWVDRDYCTLVED